MIATRFNPLGKKFAFDAKSYVQDGLIFQLDAIENVAFGAHDNTARVWTDLIGGLQVPLADEFYFGEDCLVCEFGTNASPGIASPFNLDGFTTAEYTFLSTPNENGYSYVFRLGGTDTNPGYLAVGRADNSWVKSNTFTFGWASYTYPKGILGFYDNEPMMVSVIRDGANLSNLPLLTKNGEVLSTPLGANGDGVSDSIQIGSRNGANARRFTGYICGVRLYNRALSAEEIAYHQEIEYSRYKRIFQMQGVQV